MYIKELKIYPNRYIWEPNPEKMRIIWNAIQNVFSRFWEIPEFSKICSIYEKADFNGVYTDNEITVELTARPKYRRVEIHLTHTTYDEEEEYITITYDGFHIRIEFDPPSDLGRYIITELTQMRHKIDTFIKYDNESAKWL